jgi:S-adenosylmethionine decarboxylase
MPSVLRADEWLVDISNANAAHLASVERVRALCDDVVAAFRLTLVAPPLLHVFPGAGGITALYLLSESHLAVHTWPEKRGALLSLGTCRPGVPEQFAWSDVVRAHVGGDAVVRRVERSIA